LTFYGSGSNNSVVINANKINRIFIIANNTNVTFKNIVFLNGNTSSGTVLNPYQSSKITFIDCVFMNNNVTLNSGVIYNAGGGAIYNAGNCTITNSIFTNNSATAAGVIYNNGNSTITNSIFTQNYANNGGAVESLQYLTILDCTFINNNANQNGGAIYIFGGKSSISNSIFTNNHAEWYGGAIYNNNNNINNTCNIINSVFTNNNANFDGGAIYNNGSCAVADSNFILNTAIYGGGIFNFKSNLKMINENYFLANKGGDITNDGGNVTQYWEITNRTSIGLTGHLSMGMLNTFDSNTSNTSNQKLIKQKILITINSFKPLYNKSNIIKITIRNIKGKVLTGKEVIFYVNGKLIKKVKTDSNGVATFKYKFKNRTAHKIVAKFVGDTYFLAKNSETLTVTPKDATYLNLAKFTVKNNKKTTFKATLKNHKKKAMGKKYLKFYMNNKYIGKAKTNAKGVATLKKKITTKGVTSFVVKYAGTKTFHSSSFTRKLSVR
jgi:hypothetical protein